MSSLEKNSDTEALIKAAAKSVFLKKGLAGTRLQEIADAAGIGRTALHYYFRSKEKLFEVVFSEAFAEMHQRVNGFSKSDLPALEMMKLFVSDFYDIAIKDPGIDLFLINEFNQNPDRMRKILCGESMQGVRVSFLNCLEKAVKNGELKGDPIQIMILLVSLCAHPFAAKSMIQSMLHLNEAEYAKILHQRKAFILNFLEKAFK
jgi:TetR/AcrR family transcriptional regulator